MVVPFAFFAGSILPQVIRINSLKHKNPVYSSGFLYLSTSIGSFVIGISIPFIIFPLVGSKDIFYLVGISMLFSVYLLEEKNRTDKSIH